MPNYLLLADWKAALKKHNVEKELVLTKALEDLAKVKGKDGKKESAALKLVIDKAAVVQKTLKDNKEVVKYTALVVTAAKTATKDLAESEKEAAEEAEEKAKVPPAPPAAPSGPPQLDKILNAGLKMAATKRVPFALVAKSATLGALFVKPRIAAKDIGEAKKKIGGGAVFQGVCFLEDGAHVFESTKPPKTGIDKLIKLLAKTCAGLSIRVLCRELTTPGEIEGLEAEEAEEDVTAKSAIPPAPPAPPPPPAEAKEGTPAKAGPAPKVAPRIAFGHALLKWDEAKGKAAANLLKLQAAVRKEEPEEADLAAELGEVLDDFNGNLRDLIDKGYNTSDKKYYQQAQNIIKSYVAKAQGDPVLKHVDKNPFVKTDIQSMFHPALGELSKRIAELLAAP
jgi:hypothetical protein